MVSSSAWGRRSRPRRGGRPGHRWAARTEDDGLTWSSLLAAFLVCHLSGDLILQTEWQALTKVRGLGDPEGRRALLAHASTYTAVYAPALAWVAGRRGLTRAVGTAALIAVPHVLIDDGRFVRTWLRTVKHSSNPAPSLRLMVDQSFHVVCLLAAAAAASAPGRDG